MHVELRSIGKRFAGVEALADVDLAIERGTIHGLVGENGAGKSTLGKLIAGVLLPDTGELWINDNGPYRLRSPGEALGFGITIIAQELILEPTRSIAENVLLGMEPRRWGLIDRRGVNRLSTEIADQAGFTDLAQQPRRIVGGLGTSDRQKVEILRALARRAELIVMDEPTAALPGMEAEQLLRIVRDLRSRGITILYISHRLPEVLAVADQVSVLRDGRLVHSGPVKDETPESLVTAMLGRPADLAFPPKRAPLQSAPVVLSVRGVRRPPMVNDVDIEIRAGEIVGLAGLIGSGRTELARALFGADKIVQGKIALDGREVGALTPSLAISHGMVLLPESRKEQGLLLGRSVKENITLPHLSEFSRGGMLDIAHEKRAVETVVARLNIKAPHPGVKVSSLSGGNQQKVLFARSLFRSPRLLIVDEPTRGVDVGAKRSIYQLIVELAGEGMAVLLISSELEEVVGLAHRVLVLREGRIVAEFAGEAVAEDVVLRAAFAAAS
ncbi:MAG: sugar ABC transporter ATP-binding protein [Acidimicrobiia bacterium]